MDYCWILVPCSAQEDKFSATPVVIGPSNGNNPPVFLGRSAQMQISGKQGLLIYGYKITERL